MQIGLARRKGFDVGIAKRTSAFAMFHQDFHPQVINWLPFYWQGFSQSTLYTYRIDDTRNLEKLWNETRDNVRTDVKKAEKQVEVLETDNLERFSSCLPPHFLATEQAVAVLGTFNTTLGCCGGRSRRAGSCWLRIPRAAHMLPFIWSPTGMLFSICWAGRPAIAQ